MKIKIVPLVLFCLLIVLGFYYHFNKTSSTAVYNGHGISISYPKTLILEEQAYPSVINITFKSKSGLQEGDLPRLNIGHLNLRIYEAVSEQIIKVYTTCSDFNKNCKQDTVNDIKITTITVDGIDQISFTHNNTLFQIYTATATTDSDHVVINKMLSSVVFN